MRVQARQLANSEAAKKLLEGPTKAMRIGQQTLENCQNNLQLLGTLVQHNLEKTVQQTSLALAGPSPTDSQPLMAQRRDDTNTTFSTAAGIVAPLSLEQSNQLVSAETGVDASEQESDVLSPWPFLPGYLRQREIAAIESAIQENEQEEGDEHMATPSSAKVCGRQGPLRGGGGVGQHAVAGPMCRWLERQACRSGYG